MKVVGTLLLVCALVLAGIPVFLGDARWLYAHGPRITVLILGFALLWKVGEFVDDRRSQWVFDLGEPFRRARARRYGQERTQLQRDIDWNEREWSRYLSSARLRAADESSRRLEALRREQNVLEEKQRQERERRTEELMRSVKEGNIRTEALLREIEERDARRSP